MLLALVLALQLAEPPVIDDPVSFVIYFDEDSSAMRDVSDPVLKQLCQLVDHPELAATIKLSAHVDLAEKRYSPAKLANARLHAISSALRRCGYAANRVKAALVSPKTPAWKLIVVPPSHDWSEPLNRAVGITTLPPQSARQR